MFGPQSQNRNKCVPIVFILSVYIHDLNFEQTICDKTQVLLETSWGMHLGTLGEEKKKTSGFDTRGYVLKIRYYI
jgi:hypothetical protein